MSSEPRHLFARTDAPAASPPPVASDDDDGERGALAGSVLAGRYRLEQLLGRGGFASVYLARHQEIASLRVAIKVLHGVHRTRDVILDRFKREASVLALLRNRHTVRLVDYGATDDGAPFLVMEYVEGASLDRVIRQPIELRDGDVARVGIDVLKALAEAHSVGVIHRDLKPANIVLVREPGEHHAVARVLDFGIAKVIGDPAIDFGGGTADHAVLHDQTGTDLVFCTPLYAAPELLRGNPNFQTDLYALGLVMAEMLDGEPPYYYDECGVRESPHLGPRPVPLGRRAAMSPLAPVIRRAVEKDLDRRYASAVEMLAELEIVYSRFRAPDFREPPIALSTPPPVDVPRAIGTSQLIPITRIAVSPAAAVQAADTDDGTTHVRTRLERSAGELSIGELVAHDTIESPPPRSRWKVWAAVMVSGACAVWLMTRDDSGLNATAFAAELATVERSSEAAARSTEFVRPVSFVPVSSSNVEVRVAVAVARTRVGVATRSRAVAEAAEEASRRARRRRRSADAPDVPSVITPPPTPRLGPPPASRTRETVGSN